MGLREDHCEQLPKESRSSHYNCSPSFKLWAERITFVFKPATLHREERSHKQNMKLEEKMRIMQLCSATSSHQICSYSPVPLGKAGYLGSKVLFTTGLVYQDHYSCLKCCKEKTARQPHNTNNIKNVYYFVPVEHFRN